MTTGIVLATRGGGMIVYSRMKCFSSITIMSSLILLSACSSTRQQEQPVQEAAVSAPADPEIEQNAATQQNTEDKEKPDEQADTVPQRVPQLLSSRKRRAPQKAEPPAPQPEATASEPEAAASEPEATAAPSAAQQAAALKMMAQEAAAPEGSKAEQQAPAATEKKQKEEPKSYQPAPQDMRSVLRVRRFAPPEESTDNDSDEPLPNSVELRGFRSPVLKSRLPMNIDGKIIKNAD